MQETKILHQRGSIRALPEPFSACKIVFQKTSGFHENCIIDCCTVALIKYIQKYEAEVPISLLHQSAYVR